MAQLPTWVQFLFHGNYLVNGTIYVEVRTAAWQCQLHCFLQRRDSVRLQLKCDGTR